MRQVVIKNAGAILIALALLFVVTAGWTKSQLPDLATGSTCVSDGDWPDSTRKALATAVIETNWPGAQPGAKSDFRQWLIAGPGMLFTSEGERAAYYGALPRCSE